jgi:hypothetical protein
MPTNAPTTVMSGLVFHHRSRPKPRRAGKANSSPIVVIRAPQSNPMERAERDSGFWVTGVSRFPHSPYEVGKNRCVYLHSADHQGHRQTGKPVKRDEFPGGDLSTQEPFILGRSPLSTPHPSASRNFSQSRPITPAAGLAASPVCTRLAVRTDRDDLAIFPTRRTSGCRTKHPDAQPAWKDATDVDAGAQRTGNRATIMSPVAAKWRARESPWSGFETHIEKPSLTLRVSLWYSLRSEPGNGR